MTHGGGESTGSCYQNTVRNVQIQGVDVGVYVGPGKLPLAHDASHWLRFLTRSVTRAVVRTEVNGNQISSVMMVGIGRASYFIDGPNSENVVSGGFTAGHGGNVTIIKVRNFD